MVMMYSPVQLLVVRTEDWDNLASDSQMSRNEDRCSVKELMRILLSSGIFPFYIFTVPADRDIPFLPFPLCVCVSSIIPQRHHHHYHHINSSPHNIARESIFTG